MTIPDFTRAIFLAKLVDVDGNPIEVDELTGELVFIDVEHHFIHEGRHFMLDDYDEDVDQATPRYWLLTTPAGIRAHTFFKGTSSNPGRFEVFEGPTVTADGAPLDLINSDRESTNTPDLTINGDPTVTDDGTRIVVDLVGGGQGIGRTGGMNARSNEVILASSTLYLIKFTPYQDNTRVTISLSWYELAS